MFVTIQGQIINTDHIIRIKANGLDKNAFRISVMLTDGSVNITEPEKAELMKLLQPTLTSEKTER